MTDTPRTDVEALAEALNAIGYGDLDENFIPADWLLSYLPAGWRLTNEAADERLRAALRVLVYDVINVKMADGHGREPLNWGEVNVSLDRAVAALAATPFQSNPELARLYADIEGMNDGDD